MRHLLQSAEKMLPVCLSLLSLFNYQPSNNIKNPLFRIIKETKPNLVQLLGGFLLNRSLCVNVLVSLSWFS